MKKYDTKNIRNVCLVGHGGSGKTSVAEAILFDTGATTRLGSVLDETSTFDFEPEELKRQSSISSAFAATEWQKRKIQILDTPGDNNFFVDARNSLWASDIAVVCISAVDGVQVMTEKMYALAEQLDIPRLVVVNKQDRERADFGATMESARQLLSKRIAPLIIPIGAEDAFKGVVEVLRQKAFKFPGDGGKGIEEIPVPADMKDEVAAAREKLIEVIAESDDALMEKFLETMELSDAEIDVALPKAITSGQLVPAVVTSATKNVGIQPLLDLICERFPSPADRPARKGTVDGAEIEIAPDEGAPFAATVFKTVLDKFTGSLAIARVWSGTLNADTSFFNVNKEERERFGSILVPFGKKQEPVPSAGPGDIIALAKLKLTPIGHSICDEKRKVAFEFLPEVSPIITYAVRAKDKNEEDKIGQALNRIAEEDPTIKVIRDAEVKETQIAGMGQVHIELTMEKIRRKFEVEAELFPPKIPYRETIRKKVEGVEGKHKKQTGGRGQFGVCYLNVEPLPHGGGFEFVNAIVGGAIPRNWIPSVEKGVVARMVKGVIAGYNLVDVRVTVYDGKYHDVDSSDAAFQMAGSKGFKAAVEKADAYLLEPIWNLEVVCPDEFMGDVMGDISSRRGRVMGMEARGRYQVIKAQAPMGELLRYANELDSITGGRGTFTVSFSHYDEVPRDVQEKVVAAYKGDDEED
ncbi:MAG: elongation factor G [Proteobacteria bacterium]|jgi:elongation factor G|nr:elongation factor G [Pseudomonadota bacterium]